MPTVKDVAHYWNCQPCNIKHSPMPVGTWQWSREVTRRKYFVEPHIPEFAQFARWNRKRVLEIGCGIGTDTLQFAAHGAMVDAVDLSVESVTLARSRMEAFTKSVQASAYWGDQLLGNHIPHATFHVANAEEWLPAGLYDLVYSFGVLHHTPCPERIIARISAVLKAGGELRIMVYAKWSLKHLLGHQPEAQAGCPVVKHYTARGVRNLVEHWGLEVESITKTHIFPWKIEEYKRYEYVKEWWWRWMPQWLFALLERCIGHHLLVVARLK